MRQRVGHSGPHPRNEDRVYEDGEARYEDRWATVRGVARTVLMPPQTSNPAAYSAAVRRHRRRRSRRSRGTAGFVALCLTLLATLLVSLFALQTSSAPPSPLLPSALPQTAPLPIVQPPSPLTLCAAADPGGLRTCFAQIQAQRVDTVAITGPIICHSADECAFHLADLKRPVAIYGTTPDAGFERTTRFDYSLLTLTHSTGVTVSSLSFSDDVAIGCDPLNETQCAPIISLDNDQQVTLDGLHLFNVKRAAVFMLSTDTVPDVTISNSYFANAGAHAITNYNTVTGGRMILANSTFINSASNAVALNVLSAPDHPSIIQANTFIHNHRYTIYHLCGPNHTDPCAGGQLYIMPGSSNIDVEGNLFEDGTLDTPVPNAKENTGGIEVDHNGAHTIAITGNVFKRNAYGVIINDNNSTEVSDLSDVSLQGNVFYANSISDLEYYHYPRPIPTKDDVHETSDNRHLPSATITCYPPLPSSLAAAPGSVIVAFTWNDFPSGYATLQVSQDHQAFQVLADVPAVDHPLFAQSTYVTTARSHTYTFGLFPTHQAASSTSATPITSCSVTAALGQQ